MTPPAITIRPAAPEDAGPIAAAFTPARRAMPGVPDIHTDAEDRWFIANKVLPQLETLVAEADGEIAGFAAFTPTRLEHLYVAPRFHRRGIGTALLEAAMRLRPNGLDLWAFQSNAPARALYEKHGFRCVETTDGDANEEKCPDARYSWPGTVKRDNEDHRDGT